MEHGRILTRIARIFTRASFQIQILVAQATGLCHPATRRTEWEKANFLCLQPDILWASNHSGRRVAHRNGQVARSTPFENAP